MISKFDAPFDGDLNGFGIAYGVWLNKLRKEIAGDEPSSITGTFEVTVFGKAGEVPRVVSVGKCNLNLETPPSYEEVS